MTRLEKEMRANGYEAEGTYSTRREADDAAVEIERCGQGEACDVRRSRGGWTLWIETPRAHAERVKHA